jgi:hypothetical protein
MTGFKVAGFPSPSRRLLIGHRQVCVHGAMQCAVARAVTVKDKSEFVALSPELWQLVLDEIDVGPGTDTHRAAVSISLLARRRTKRANGPSAVTCWARQADKSDPRVSR